MGTAQSDNAWHSNSNGKDNTESTALYSFQTLTSLTLRQILQTDNQTSKNRACLWATENASLELSAPTCRGGKCGTTTYGKPNTYLLWHTQHDLSNFFLFGCYTNRLRADTFVWS